MTRVLILGSYAPSLRNFRGPLIDAMVSCGHTVHAAAPGLTEDAPTRDWLQARGVSCRDAPVSNAGLNPLHDLHALVMLARMMRETRPDLFLGYTIKPVIWGLLAARLARVPRRVALITGLGYAFTGHAVGKRALVQRLARALYATALRGADVIFFQNPDDRDDFDRQGMLPPRARVEVVNGSGVDVEAFAHEPMPEGPLQFLLIARLLGDKGIREYAAAAQALAPRWPGVGFHLVGGLDPNPDGIGQAEVEGWARAGHIIWHGPLVDVRPALASCHVYVLPSYREGTPRTVLEAMATGRAIITTDAPGCRETVTDGENGFLISVRDTEALRHAMEQFLDNPQLLVPMAAASLRLVREKYDVRKVNAAMLAAMGL